MSLPFKGTCRRKSQNWDFDAYRPDRQKWDSWTQDVQYLMDGAQPRNVGSLNLSNTCFHVGWITHVMSLHLHRSAKSTMPTMPRCFSLWTWSSGHLVSSPPHLCKILDQMWKMVKVSDITGITVVMGGCDIYKYIYISIWWPIHLITKYSMSFFREKN